jgi:hypothetical protein
MERISESLCDEIFALGAVHQKYHVKCLIDRDAGILQIWCRQLPIPRTRIWTAAAAVGQMPVAVMGVAALFASVTVLPFQVGQEFETGFAVGINFAELFKIHFGTHHPVVRYLFNIVM